MTDLILFAALTAMTAGVCSAGQSATTGSVTGKVVQDPGSQGIRKVTVLLVPLADKEVSGEWVKEYATATDVSGIFRFEGVEPGKYFVKMARAGYFEPKKGSPERTITVEAGKETTGVVFKMQATGIVTGRVMDADGDPLPGVGVNAIRKGKSVAGVLSVGSETARNIGMTNDLGEYRIADLEPGQYELVAESTMEISPAPNPADKGRQREKVLFTKTYYPGTMDEGQAGTVQVVSGGTVTANVTMLTNRVYRVSGKVSGASGAQMEQIVLVSQGGMQLQENVEEGGKFEFQNVQTGVYEARVVLVSGVGDGQHPPSMKVELVKAPIVVEGGDVTGLDLVPEAGGTVKGKFRAEDDKQIDWTQLTVSLLTVPEAGASSAAGGVDLLGQIDAVGVGADGSFEMADVPGGTYQLGVSAKSEIYRDYYVKSVLESGREVVDTGFAVTGGAGLEVVVSAKGATIEGTAVDANGKPESDVEVIAVPAAGQRMRPDAYQIDKTNGQGQFALRGMNPGQYVVVAIEGAHEDMRSAAFAAKYAVAGETVELNEGEKKNVTVKVVEAKE